jgi:hypothetical protein
MTERCPRCGKVKHTGPCQFDTAKKSLVEQSRDKIDIISEKEKTA